jgi:hypothetical protein
VILPALFFLVQYYFDYLQSFVLPNELCNLFFNLELTDVYRVLHPATAKCIFFSAAHGTVSK